MHDVIIIGGSYAGLAAALQLGRARRTVLVLDAGQRRNRFVAHSHHVAAKTQNWRFTGSQVPVGRAPFDLQAQQPLQRFARQGFSSERTKRPIGRTPASGRNTSSLKATFLATKRKFSIRRTPAP